MRKYFLIAFSIFLFCCHIESERLIIENKIDNLLVQHNQLHSEKKSEFLLKKSVYNGEHNFEIQLYGEPESFTDPQNIIVLINRNTNEIGAIPFFSNTHRDYYEFQFDNKVVESIGAVNTTFNKEFNSAFSKTNLNVDSNLSEIVITELMTSLLGGKFIYSKDSMDLKSIFLNENKRLEYEDSNTTNDRIKKNYNAIKSTLDIEIITILDNRNYRIYQIENLQKNRKLPVEYLIKSYRQDQVFHQIHM